MSLGSGAATLSGGLISDSIIESLGVTEIQVNDATSAPGAMFQITNSQVTSCGNGAGAGLGAGNKAGCLFVNQNNQWSSSHTFYGFVGASNSAHNIWCDTGTICTFMGDYINYATNAGIAEIALNAATLNLTDTGVINSGAGGFGIVTSTGTNNINLKGASTKLTTVTAANAISCSAGSTCNYYDTPGVTVSGLTGTGTFNQWSSGYAWGTACATGNWALTSGWGTSSIASVGTGGDSHRCHVTITGAAGAAGPVLTWTYPKAYLQAPGGCQITGGGATTDLTSGRQTSISATSTAFTFTGTPSAQTYVFDVACGP